MKIFLDMDGVIVNFHKEVIKRFNYKGEWPKGEYDCTKVLGMSVRNFWNELDCLRFWADLEIYPEAEEIIRMCEEYVGQENICLLSTPTDHPDCLSGKLKWLQRCIPNYSRNYIFTPHKRFFAHNDALLIDDHERNIDLFTQYGGRTFLYPRPWNKGIESIKTLDTLENALLNFKRLCVSK